MSDVTGDISGKIYIHNCTHLRRDTRNPNYVNGGVEIAVRANDGSTPYARSVFLKPGEKMEYTPTKSFVNFYAKPVPSSPLNASFKPAEWKTSCGKSKTPANYYITQSSVEFGLNADVKHP